MARYRTIKQYGNTWVITLKTSDIKDLNLKKGDEADIENIKIKKKKRGKK